MWRDIVARIDPEAYSNISGALVRRARLQRKLTVRELAAQAHISKTTLLRIEADEPVRLESLVRLCYALRMMPDQLKVTGEVGDPVQIIRDQDSPFRISFLTSTAPKKLMELSAVDEPRERQRLAHLGFVSGFCRLLPRMSETGRLRAGIMEPQSAEGTKYITAGASRESNHPGEEFVYCLQGPVNLNVDGKTYRLETGDAAFFNSELMHSYASAEPIAAGRSPQLLTVWIEEPAAP
jgi:transcriptional regulator with XRE-family HTH domain